MCLLRFDEFLNAPPHFSHLNGRFSSACAGLSSSEKYLPWWCQMMTKYDENINQLATVLFKNLMHSTFLNALAHFLIGERTCEMKNAYNCWTAQIDNAFGLASLSISTILLKQRALRKRKKGMVQGNLINNTNKLDLYPGIIVWLTVSPLSIDTSINCYLDFQKILFSKY